MTKPNLTDRAKRYRAQRNAPPGKKLCNFCTSRKNIDIDHITGDESDGEPENLIYLCRPCNTTKAVVQARNRIGVRTRQYNPEARPTLAKFRHAAAILLGKIEGDVGAATAYIRSVAPEKRAEYATKMTPARNPLFAPQSRIDIRKLKDARYGLEVDITGRGRWEEQGLYNTRAQAEKEGRAIRKKEGMDFRVKVTRDQRNPPTFAQYAHGVSIHQRKAMDEGGSIIHSTPPALRSRYARKIASIKRQRGTA